MSNPTDPTDSSSWSATKYNHTASFVYSPEYTSTILSLLDAQPGERIIDFGCGSGEVTLRLLAAVGEGGVVVGVDSSESMVGKALANGVEKVFVGDLQALDTGKALGFLGGGEGRFDKVFSNATLHWCKKDPGGVLVGAKKVLKPGGWLVVEMGGYLNCVGLRGVLHHVVRERGVDPVPLDPWYFPSVEEYRALLVEHGFTPTHISLTPRYNPLPAGIYAWLELFARNSFLKGFNDVEAKEIMEEVERICRVDCRDGLGGEAMVYMRLRVVATNN